MSGKIPIRTLGDGDILFLVGQMPLNGKDIFHLSSCLSRLILLKDILQRLIMLWWVQIIPI